MRSRSSGASVAASGWCSSSTAVALLAATDDVVMVDVVDVLLDNVDAATFDDDEALASVGTAPKSAAARSPYALACQVVEGDDESGTDVVSAAAADDDVVVAAIVDAAEDVSDADADGVTAAALERASASGTTRRSYAELGIADG